MASNENFLTNKKLIISGIFVFILLGLGVFYYLFTQGFFMDKEVLIIVGSEKITKSDLDERIYGMDFEGSPENPTAKTDEQKKQILEQLIEWKLAELDAPKLGISISNDELLGEINLRLGAMYDEYSPSQKELTKKTILNDLRLSKTEKEVIGWREGKFILTRFDKAYESGLEIDDPEVIESSKTDKEYAQKLADEIHQDITSGEITFDEGIEKANNDSKIGKPAWNGGASYTFSKSFTKEQSEDKGILSLSNNFWKEIFKVKEGEASSPKLLTIVDDSDEGEHEAFFAIIEISKVSKGDFSDLNDWITAKKKEYSVKYYYENL